MIKNNLEEIEKIQTQVNILSELEREAQYILHHIIGKDFHETTSYDKYKVFSYVVRSHLLGKWLQTNKMYQKKNVKKVYYLSLEFLMGRSLQNSSININLENVSAELLKIVGMKLEDIYEQEYDAGLGNGGLGRLAACFLDSMATMKIPGFGFGIRYEYGMFKQEIVNGNQIEKPDRWLYKGNPWEIQRLEKAVTVRFNGRTNSFKDKSGNHKVNWVETNDIQAIPYDLLIPGYRNEIVNLLTLWSATSTDDFNLDYFNKGDYENAVRSKDNDEIISKVLYPNDNNFSGKELRFKQQYFFVSASLQTIIADFLESNDSFAQFPDKVAIQLNDTHPTIAIPELMRLMVDEYNLVWEEAWHITTKTFAYTNHTLMPEALEKWGVDLFNKVLPRHLEIIYEINSRFLETVKKKYPGDNQKLTNMSIIEEGDAKKVRMAYLGIVGSHSVNGVAKLHSKLLQERVVPDFYNFYPEKFNNKTNGVTQRRWLNQSNPDLADLITETIGDAWITDLYKLKELEKHINDEYFRNDWKTIKLKNKAKLSEYCKNNFGFNFEPDTLFDCQFKRMHEYKRQLLNVFHVIHKYFQLKEGIKKDEVPRTVLIGGKAAPGYHIAKLIIKLINDVAKVINNDSETSEYLKLYFLPNYRVSLAEKIFPATDLSEQISTAGTEASGTGNMKFALNGALTIGTLDGANIEILDEVGKDNIFIFGMNSDEVQNLKNSGYEPFRYYESNQNLKRVVDSIQSGYFSPGEPSRFNPLTEALFNQDQYMLFADFQSYVDCHNAVDKNYLDQVSWVKKSIINVAKMGYFSSDRTIAEYAKEIWGVMK